MALDKVEAASNDAIQRVSRHANVRHGVQEKKVTQLVEQIKFWQYMVRNFHDHEEHLQRTLDELNAYMDELEGLKPSAEGDKDSVREDGTVDFSKIQESKAIEEMTLKAKAEEEKKKKSKVIRRSIPVPQSATVDELVDKGLPVFTEKGYDYEIGEKTRQEFFTEYVQERAYRDVPPPPGEKGSWREVKEAIERGEDVGQKISPEESGEMREMTLDEQANYLLEQYPLRGAKDEQDEDLRHHAITTAVSSMLVRAADPAKAKPTIPMPRIESDESEPESSRPVDATAAPSVNPTESGHSPSEKSAAS